jgi:DNA-binding PadR family transcriptional regulator
MELAHAIFASLERQPMTRYDLKKFVDMSVGHFSTTMQCHIDKTLSDLEQEGWVGKKFIEQEGKPNRKKYSIIKTGRAELHRGKTAADTRIKTAEYLGWRCAGFYSVTLLALSRALGNELAGSRRG